MRRQFIGQSEFVEHDSGFWFHAQTPPEVQSAIVGAWQTGARVRLFLGDAATGEAWPEENDVVGRIGRSGGTVKVPLLMSPRATGGPAILDQCIVAIVRTGDRQWLYKHATFNPGEWTICSPATPGYVEAVAHKWSKGDSTHAQFKRLGRAQKYCEFMRGDRFSF